MSELMEPEAFNEQLKICVKAGEDYETQIKATALCSIAISLKRIADVICRPPPMIVELSPEQAKEFEKTWLNYQSSVMPFNRHDPIVLTAEEYEKWKASDDAIKA